jgi:hypothetical protein
LLEIKVRAAALFAQVTGKALLAGVSPLTPLSPAKPAAAEPKARKTKQGRIH